MTNRRVLLVGSHRESNRDMVGDEAAFASCVTDLVRELRDTHDVKAFTICSLSEHTVDFYVLAALQNNRKGLDLEFVYPEDDADNVVAKLPSVSNDLAPGTLSAVGVAGGWRPAHLRAIQDSDLVIAIGGSDWGTTTVVYSAEVMGVPVVLVPGFGGAASRGWADFRRYYGPSDQDLLVRSTGRDTLGPRCREGHHVDSLAKPLQLL